MCSECFFRALSLMSEEPEPPSQAASNSRRSEGLIEPAADHEEHPASRRGDQKRV